MRRDKLSVNNTIIPLKSILALFCSEHERKYYFLLRKKSLVLYQPHLLGPGEALQHGPVLAAHVGDGAGLAPRVVTVAVLVAVRVV